MKKIDLVHTTILIVGLLAGYNAVLNIIYDIQAIAYYEGSMIYFLGAICLAIVCIVLIKNGRKYAGFILKDEPEAFLEDESQLNVDRRNLMLVLFIGFGLYTLIQSIPGALVGIYEQFEIKVNMGMLRRPSSTKDSLVVELLRVTIGALLVYAAPTLTNFIEKTIAVRLDKNDSKP